MRQPSAPRVRVRRPRPLGVIQPRVHPPVPPAAISRDLPDLSPHRSNAHNGGSVRVAPYGGRLPSATRACHTSRSLPRICCGSGSLVLVPDEHRSINSAQASAASSYVCPVDDAAEPFIVGRAVNCASMRFNQDEFVGV